jgi:hypothetical protein
MATKTGTVDVASLLAARNTSAAEFGLDTIAETFQRDLAVHNQLMLDAIGDLAVVTTDRQRISGTSDSGEMVQTDEYGRAPTQKAAPGVTVGFPLRQYQYAVGWTRTALQIRSAADVAAQFLAAQKAHRKAVLTEIKKALFQATNYTFKDYLVDNVSLSVKRLVNADSVDIPEGPNGETFTASTHTHYDAINGLTNAALLALVTDVVEHGHGGMVRIVISQTDEAAVRALDDFTPYLDPRISLGTATNQATQRLDITRLDNRAIGIFGAAEVWVKPWGIANYALAYDASSGAKPLAFRQREQTALQGLNVVANIDTFPLYAEYMQVEFGVGVWNRTNGAVLYFGGGTWADPTIS